MAADGASALWTTLVTVPSSLLVPLDLLFSGLDWALSFVYILWALVHFVLDVIFFAFSALCAVGRGVWWLGSSLGSTFGFLGTIVSGAIACVITFAIFAASLLGILLLTSVLGAGVPFLRPRYVFPFLCVAASLLARYDNDAYDDWLIPFSWAAGVLWLCGVLYEIAQRRRLEADLSALAARERPLSPRRAAPPAAAPTTSREGALAVAEAREAAAAASAASASDGVVDLKDAASLQTAAGNGQKLLHVTECSICLEDVDMGTVLRSLKCGHAFHSVCIDTWLQRQPVCPNCRTPVHGLGKLIRFLFA